MNETPPNPFSGVQRTGIPTAQPTHESHRVRNVGVIAAVVIILALIAGWYLTGESRAVNALIRDASALSTQSEYGEALQILSDGLDAYKDSIPLNFAMAHTVIEAARRIPPPENDKDHRKLGEGVRGSLSLVDGISATKFASEYHDLIGSTYLLSGDYTNALAHFEESLVADYLNTNAMIHTGVAFEIAGDARTARKFYQKAENTLSASKLQTKDDTTAELFIRLGKLAAVIDGDGEKAKEYFNKAIESATSKGFRADGHYAMSTLLYQDGKIDESRTYAEGAIEEDPKSDWGYIGVLRAILVAPKEGDEEKVGEYVWKAIQLNPVHAITRMIHGQIAQSAGNTKQAIASYGDALRLLDTGADTSLSRGAKTALQSDIYSYLALAYHTEGKTKEATEAIRSAFHTDPVKIAYLVEKSGLFAPLKKSLLDITR